MLLRFVVVVAVVAVVLVVVVVVVVVLISLSVILMLLSIVKSETTTVPVPPGVILMSAFELEVISFPARVKLPTPTECSPAKAESNDIVNVFEDPDVVIFVPPAISKVSLSKSIERAPPLSP